MRLVFLVHEIPWPIRGGHMRRWFELLQAMPAGCDVHLAGFGESVEDEDYRELRRLAPCLASVEVWPWSIRLRRRPVALLRTLATAVAKAEPYSLAKFSSPGVAERIRRFVAAHRPDAVIAGIQMAQHLPTSGPPLLLDTHNIEHDLWVAAAKLGPALLRPFARHESRLLRQAEQRLWRRAKAIIAICEEDAAAIRLNRGDAGVFTVPVAIEDRRDPAAIRGKGRRWNVGLFGSWSWAPNEVALDGFVREMLVPLREAGLTIRIAGPGLRAGMAERLRAAGVEVSGYLEDPTDFYRTVDCIAAPYPVGGGVRMKVAEALCHGVPVIGTALAFRGLDLPIPVAWIREESDAALAELISVARNPAPARAQAEYLLRQASETHAPQYAAQQVARVLATVPPARASAGSSSSREAAVAPAKLLNL
ncbi:glycosyltransferase [Algihabitans albus]|uniref:glycosyltransferase n=1 Tax=Algihabitans albus TaxID=2164067 RepID=UPI000E5D387C|nr:glycosyltransferase [Algihabitans albus]